MYQRVVVSLCCVVLWQQGVVNASAITVPSEENSIAIAAQDKSRSLAEEAQAVVELEIAKNALARADDNLNMAKRNEAKAQIEFNAAKVKYEEIVLAVEKNQLAVEEKRVELSRAESAWALAVTEVKQAEIRAENALAKAKQAAAVARENEAREIKAAEVETIDEARIDALVDKAERAQNSIETGFALADEKAQIADQLMDIADAKGEVAAQLADLKNEAADASVVAQETLTELVVEQKEVAENLMDLRSAVADAHLATVDAKTEANLAQQYVAELLKPVPLTSGPVYFDTGIQYYQWKNNKGQSGYQLVQPYNFSYDNKKMEYALSTAYVISRNNSPDKQERLASFIDTTLSAAYTNEHGSDSFRYSLDLNLPTGKTGLTDEQNNAVMDEDVVAENSFGEGTNATLGYSVTHKIGKEDSWALDLGYTLRGHYDNDSPGNSWSKKLSWQHAGKQWRLTGSVNHERYGDGKLGTDNYRQGDELEVNFVYDEELAMDKNLMLYYRYSNQQATRNLINGDEDGNLNTHYAGFSLKKNCNGEDALRFTGDYMKKSGNTVDIHTDNDIAGRTKYTVGVGYDFALQDNRKLSIDLQRFFMFNQVVDAEGEDRYQGYNIILKYAGNF